VPIGKITLILKRVVEITHAFQFFSMHQVAGSWPPIA
jgi:hypothetical protein